MTHEGTPICYDYKSLMQPGSLFFAFLHLLNVLSLLDFLPPAY